MADNNIILIIDDDSRNVFALTAVLKAKGFSVMAAPAAKEGMEMLRQHKGIRVVLMDMMMPEMDGYEAIAELRRYDDLKAVKVIAVTAQAMAGDREKCLRAGADGYVSKPIDVDVLVTLLNQYKQVGNDQR